MAALDLTIVNQRSGSATLSVLQCTLTGAVVLAIVFAICWAGAAAGIPGGSHAYVSLFTTAPVTSFQALAVGVFWSLTFGGLCGALIAIVYNAFRFVAEAPRRR